MANARGQYGSARVGQMPQPITVYAVKPPTSILTWVLGAVAVGGAVLWARHQTKQVSQLLKKEKMPNESLATSLRADLKALPARASETWHNIAEAVKPRLLTTKLYTPKRSKT